jgi:hypothetical protein
MGARLQSTYTLWGHHIFNHDIQMGLSAAPRPGSEPEWRGSDLTQGLQPQSRGESYDQMRALIGCFLFTLGHGGNAVAWRRLSRCG